MVSLIVNPIRHNNENGSIHIRVDEYIFPISNTEKNRLNTAEIFRRFSRTSEEKRENGLGGYQLYSRYVSCMDGKYHMIIKRTSMFLLCVSSLVILFE